MGGVTELRWLWLCVPVTPRGGRPLGSGRQLPPQLTVGRRPLRGGGGGGGMGGGGSRGGEGGGGLGGLVGGGSRRGDLGWGGGGTGSPYLPLPSLYRLPLPPLALHLTIPSP